MSTKFFCGKVKILKYYRILPVSHLNLAKKNWHNTTQVTPKSKLSKTEQTLNSPINQFYISDDLNVVPRLQFP